MRDKAEILLLNVFLIFVLFLDYPKDSKKSDDILDIMLRLHFYSNSKITIALSRKKYKGTRIKFQSTADLRRACQSNKTLSTLQLIKSFIENNKTENGDKRQV